MTDEKVAAGSQNLVVFVDQAADGFLVKINHHVAAENQVQRVLEGQRLN
jgi:hypothetical protein